MVLVIGKSLIIFYYSCGKVHLTITVKYSNILLPNHQKFTKKIQIEEVTYTLTLKER